MIINERTIDRISMGTPLAKPLKSRRTLSEIPDFGPLRPSVTELLDFHGFCLILEVFHTIFIVFSVQSTGKHVSVTRNNVRKVCDHLEDRCGAQNHDSGAKS